MSLAAQKFVGDVVEDAALLEKERQQLPPERLQESGYEARQGMQLRLEDVAQALEEVRFASALAWVNIIAAMWEFPLFPWFG